MTFVGQVTGGPGQFTFDGVVEGGGNAEWTPKPGSARATCTLSGQLTDAGNPASMNCVTAIAAGQPWQGQSTGTIQTMAVGQMLKFEYTGSGNGTDNQGKSAHIDELSLQPKTS